MVSYYQMDKKSSLFSFYAFCLVHDDSSVRVAAVQNELKVREIHVLDTLNLNDTPSISIARIKQVLTFLSRKPLLSKSQAVTIAGDRLTHEAQQALLKVLEEPGPNSLIFLDVSAAELLLPTIVSRCLVIHLPEVSQKTNSHQYGYWKKLISLSIGERLRDVSLLPTDRTECIDWVKQQIFYFRDLLHDNNSLTQNEKLPLNLLELSQILAVLLKTYERLIQNISTKMALDHLFITFPRK